MLSVVNLDFSAIDLGAVKLYERFLFPYSDSKFLSVSLPEYTSQIVHILSGTIYSQSRNAEKNGISTVYVKTKL